MALKKHSHQRFDLDRLKEVLNEINSGPDRTVAIVWAAVIEDELRTLITGKMSHLTPTEEAKLTGQNAPLSGFYNKIMLAYAMNLIHKDDRDDLDLIREIRNAFAHSFVDMTFNAKEVSDACRYFYIVKRMPQLQTADPRMIFSHVCFRLWTSFRMDDVAKLFDQDTEIVRFTSEET